MLNNYIHQPSTELPHLPQTNGNLPIMRRSWCSVSISNTSYYVARVETVAEQSDSGSGRHRAAPETGATKPNSKATTSVEGLQYIRRCTWLPWWQHSSEPLIRCRYGVCAQTTDGIERPDA